MDPIHLRRGGLLTERDAHRGARQLDGLVDGIARADAGAVPQGVGDGPPDVRLAVRDAPALQDERVVLLLGVARQLLGQARLADTGLAQQEQQRRPGVADRVLHAVAQQPELGLPADQARPVALGPVARRRVGAVGPPGRHELLPTLGRDRLERLVADGASGGGERRGTHEHLARLRRALQAVGRVHDVAHRGVVAAGAERAHQHLAGVDADAHADVDVELGGVLGERLLHAQRGAHRPLGVVLVRGRRAEERDDRVADDLVDPSAEARRCRRRAARSSRR